MIKLKREHFNIQNIVGWLWNLDRRLLIQGGIIAFSILLFIFGFFFPILIYNRKATLQVKQLQMMIQGAKKRITHIPEMKKQKEIYGARLKQAREQFFEPQEVDQIIQVISTTASRTGVRITASRPSNKALELPVPFNQLYIAATYELTIEGSYHKIGSWINSLELYPKGFAFHDLRIDKNEANPLTHPSSVVLTAFFKRERGPQE